MAKCSAKLPEELLKKLSRVGDRMDDIAKECLTEGADIILKQTKNNLKDVIGKGTKYESRSTGELVKSLGVSPMKVDKNGDYNVKVGFDESRSDGKSNAMIANIIEYGKSGQPAKPFLKPATIKVKKTAINKMKEVLEKELDKL